MGIFNDAKKIVIQLSLPFLDSWGKINWVQAERTWSSDGAELLSGCNYCQATI